MIKNIYNISMLRFDKKNHEAINFASKNLIGKKLQNYYFLNSYFTLKPAEVISKLEFPLEILKFQ